MRSFLRNIRNQKGMSMLETAVMSAFFMGFVIFSTTTAIAIMDTSRDGRTAGLAADMVRQIFVEDSNPTHTDIAGAIGVLEDLGYIRQGEDYGLLLSVYENHWLLGHVRSGFSQHGPAAATVVSRINSYGAGSGTPGVEIDSTIYQLDSNELMYVVEIYTSERGRRVSPTGAPEFYEFAVLIDQS